MATRAQELPYGIGRFSGGWIAVILISLLLLALGIYGFGMQLAQGHVVTGLRDIGTMAGAPWGLYVALEVYFVGLAFGGLGLATLIRIAGWKSLQSIVRMGQLLTLVSLPLVGLAILADVGQPVRAIVNLLKYARPGSPFFGTFTLITVGYLFASLVYLYLDGRRDAAILARRPSRLQGFYRLWAAGYRDTPAERERHQRTVFWLGVAILPLLVTAASTSGFVFGLQVGRPGWFSALQAPAFVILGAASAVGLIMVIAAAARRFLRADRQVTPETFRWLGNALLVLVAAYLYFTIVEMLTMGYSAHHHEVRLSRALVFGEYAPVFWFSMASLAVPLALLAYLYVRQEVRMGWLVLSGLLVNLGAVLKRYLIVVPSQTYGTLLPYAAGSYSPTWVEYSIVLGLFGLGTLMYVLFMKVFPIMEVAEAEGGEG